MADSSTAPVTEPPQVDSATAEPEPPAAKAPAEDPPQDNPAPQDDLQPQRETQPQPDPPPQDDPTPHRQLAEQARRRPATRPARRAARQAERTPIWRGRHGLLLALCLAWLAAWLWSANASIRDATDATVAMSNAALALPGITTATLLAGAATALYTVGWIRNRRPELRARAVWAASAAAGLSLGVVAGATILIGYGTRGSILVLALTVAVAGTGGGLAAGPAPRGVVAAGLSAMLAQFLVGFALNLFQHPLLDLMGDGDGARAHLAASARLALTESLVAGLVAGVVAFAHLRRQACGWRFPAYLAAGATAGLLLLVAEPITRIGGAQLFDRVSGLSPADAAWQEMFASGRINQALVVLFVGAITALVLFGRTLRPAERAS